MRRSDVAKVQPIEVRAPSLFEVRDSTEATRRLRIAITESCNLGCFFCHGEGGNVAHFRQVDSRLSIRDLTTICNVAAMLGVRKIKLTGGEPLLYHHGSEDIYQLLKGIRKAEAASTLDISLTTNGTNLSREAVEKLVDAGLKRITISLHSATRRMFSEYTRTDEPDLMEKVFVGIREAKRAGLAPIKVNTTVFRSTKSSLQNVTELRRMAEEVSAAGADEIRFFVLLSSPRFSWAEHDDSYVYWTDPVLREFIPAGGYEVLSRQLADAALSVQAFPGSFRVRVPLEVSNRDTVRLSFHNLSLRTASGAHPKKPGRELCCCQEGSYAIRLTARGHFRSCLWDKTIRDALPLVRTDDRKMVAELIRDTQRSVLNHGADWSVYPSVLNSSLPDGSE